MNSFGQKVSFIWSVADLLRGPYRPNQYKDVMLPMTVLRRLDCVLEPTKEKVLEQRKKLSGGKVKNVDPILCRATGVPFYNTSRYSFDKLKGDPNNIAANLTNYIKGFSARAREIIEHFGFEEQIAKLDKADRLYLIVAKFCEIDLHPDTKTAEAEIKAGKEKQEAILSALSTIADQGMVKNREKWSGLMKQAFKKKKVVVPAALFKAVLMALAERDETADVCLDKNGNPEPDSELRDFENVPLKENIEEYMKREVLPHVPDAWVDHDKTKIGYEINFNRYFYKYVPPRPLDEIEKDLKTIEKEIADMLAEVTE